MSTAVQGLDASMRAPIAASGSGGRRPDRGNGGRRPPDRGPGKVMKKKKKAKYCPACRRWGHNLEDCRISGGLLLSMTRVLATESTRPQTRVLATGSSRPPVHARRHPLGPRQQRPHMEGPNSREHPEARRLAQRLEQQPQPQQEQQGRQEQAPQEQRPQPSAELPTQPACQDSNRLEWADEMDLDD
ncbi:uncharacterized protein CDV56_103654 [Aspergillus thermomutatus]|uniref:Uncharacterized protein n=1 Tax=Aspergillus thermomutatus TaxID=41047 RepID=A0A397HGJ6_ASPTH|nr:uncharacterized protein CDV56_103654 [Aspergillus thermomutatus]RHZ60686.1 hypothetical protein CDV56_103654 [Aspergillus thermomutatus]